MDEIIKNHLLRWPFVARQVYEKSQQKAKIDNARHYHHLRKMSSGETLAWIITFCWPFLANVFTGKEHTNCLQCATGPPTQGAKNSLFGPNDRTDFLNVCQGDTPPRNLG